MKFHFHFLVICIVIVDASARLTTKNRNQLKNVLLKWRKEVNENISEWLEKKNEEFRLLLEKSSFAEWNYETDLSDSKSKKMNAVHEEMAKWTRKCAKEAREKLKNNDLTKENRRQLKLFAFDSNPSDPEMLKRLHEISSTLEKIYGEATVVHKGRTLQLEPGISDIFAKSRDPKKLQDLWVNWREATGKKMRKLYMEEVELENVGAVEHGFKDYGDVWRQQSFYETPNLINIVKQLWKDVRPIYQELHAYVRRKLRLYYAKKYPNYKFPTDGTIPAHLLGNMWAQEWENIFDIVQPYPKVKEADLDKAMIDNKYNVSNMFRKAEEFYTSLGLYNMTEDFWHNSMLVRPKEKDRQVQCHASAFDFYNNDTFRIKMCSEVKMSYFETICHEMGHIQYFMAYRYQPAIYRQGANGAFHEAIGDTIALSVRTTKHLRTLGLLKDKTLSNEDQHKSDINYLMRRALYKIAFLPFGYLIDVWRWEVFRGNIPPHRYNKVWWKMRLRYQGITSPVKRTDLDFDPGAKFHVASNSQYICYFISFIIQFQFYEAMCNESGHTGPLYTCDFYQSEEAGQKLLNMLKLGSSRHWKYALQQMTGQDKISIKSLKNYFKPLLEFLKEDNKRHDVTVGWENAKINW